MRASFPIAPEQIEGLNPICERLGITVGKACQMAVNDFIYVENMRVDLDAGEEVSGTLVRLRKEADSETLQ
jgi:hypothetical protein